MHRSGERFGCPLPSLFELNGAQPLIAPKWSLVGAAAKAWFPQFAPAQRFVLRAACLADSGRERSCAVLGTNVGSGPVASSLPLQRLQQGLALVLDAEPSHRLVAEPGAGAEGRIVSAGQLRLAFGGVKVNRHRVVQRVHTVSGGASRPSLILEVEVSLTVFILIVEWSAEGGVKIMLRFMQAIGQHGRSRLVERRTHGNAFHLTFLLCGQFHAECRSQPNFCAGQGYVGDLRQCHYVDCPRHRGF